MKNIVDSEVRSCVKVEVAVPRSPSLISLMDAHCGRKATLKLSVLMLRNCVKVEVAVLGLMGVLDVKHY